eukprot:scaffold154_cov286-Pinguiococcus_pyrenoidosus.AAC.2
MKGTFAIKPPQPNRGPADGGRRERDATSLKCLANCGNSRVDAKLNQGDRARGENSLSGLVRLVIELVFHFVCEFFGFIGL